MQIIKFLKTLTYFLLIFISWIKQVIDDSFMPFNLNSLHISLEWILFQLSFSNQDWFLVLEFIEDRSLMTKQAKPCFLIIFSYDELMDVLCCHVTIIIQAFIFSATSVSSLPCDEHEINIIDFDHIDTALHDTQLPVRRHSTISECLHHVIVPSIGVTNRRVS